MLPLALALALLAGWLVFVFEQRKKKERKKRTIVMPLLGHLYATWFGVKAPMHLM